MDVTLSRLDNFLWIIFLPLHSETDLQRVLLITIKLNLQLVSITHKDGLNPSVAEYSLGKDFLCSKRQIKTSKKSAKQFFLLCTKAAFLSMSMKPLIFIKEYSGHLAALQTYLVSSHPEQNRFCESLVKAACTSSYQKWCGPWCSPGPAT